MLTGMSRTAIASGSLETSICSVGSACAVSTAADLVNALSSKVFFLYVSFVRQSLTILLEFNPQTYLLRAPAMNGPGGAFHVTMSGAQYARTSVPHHFDINTLGGCIGLEVQLEALQNSVLARRDHFLNGGTEATSPAVNIELKNHLRAVTPPPS